MKTYIFLFATVLFSSMAFGQKLTQPKSQKQLIGHWSFSSYDDPQSKCSHAPLDTIDGMRFFKTGEYQIKKDDITLYGNYEWIDSSIKLNNLRRDEEEQTGEVYLSVYSISKTNLVVELSLNCGNTYVTFKKEKGILNKSN